jgi:hypothetical protein
MLVALAGVGTGSVSQRAPFQRSASGAVDGLARLGLNDGVQSPTAVHAAGAAHTAPASDGWLPRGLVEAENRFQRPLVQTVARRVARRFGQILPV